MLAMASEEDPGFNAEQLYKQLSKVPAREILTPAFKVGALTGKANFLCICSLKKANVQLYQNLHCNALTNRCYVHSYVCL